jgi:hypothetical protein
LRRQIGPIAVEPREQIGGIRATSRKGVPNTFSGFEVGLCRSPASSEPQFDRFTDEHPLPPFRV